MDINDNGDQTPETTGEDKTLNDNDLGGLDEDIQKRFKSLDAQRKSWKDKAIDPETGQSYKELLSVARDDLRKAQEVKVDKTTKKNDKSGEVELLRDRVEKLVLNQHGIKADDEKELFEKWKEDTGREADDILSNKIFQSELENLRTEKANLDATSNVKGETGASGVKNTPDYWIAKATKGNDGKLMFPEETPKELFSAIVEKLSEKEGSSKKLSFYDSN